MAQLVESPGFDSPPPAALPTNTTTILFVILWNNLKVDGKYMVRQSTFSKQEIPLCACVHARAVLTHAGVVEMSFPHPTDLHVIL